MEEKIIQPDEPDEAPLGIEPGMALELCPYCGGACLDLGIEQRDECSHERRWLKCTKCDRLGSIILGPPGQPRKKSDYPELKRRGLI